ncbi:MAG: DUF1595 domain-containing protein, partial [Planctomycetota bacterium]|jgi:hypothetical protein
MSAEIMRAYIAIAQGVADRVIPPTGCSPANDRSFNSELFDGPPTAPESVYIDRTVRRLMSAAFGRPVTPAEAQTYAGLAKARRAAGDSINQALNAALRLVLVANEFVYLIDTPGNQDVPTP